MRYLVGIQPDSYGPEDASSPRWTSLLEESGHAVHFVDVYRQDILDQLAGCDGFMWRWGHCGGMHRLARRLLPVLERQLGLVCYPDQNTCWHYDDKVAQRYLLDAAGIPAPRTWVWFRRGDATQWVASADYPLVLKLSAGAGSSNVRLIRDSTEAAFWVRQLFTAGLYDLSTEAGPSSGQIFGSDSKESKRPIRTWRQRVRVAAKAIIKGRLSSVSSQCRRHQVPAGEELHRGYVYFQEFLPNNAFDTRITVIGNRAFGFRRFNRPGDFRASGSGRLDYDPSAIDERMVRLAFDVAERLGTQSVAIDGMYRDGECVVGEISYTYVSWAVHNCPGHWELDGDGRTGQLRWIEGRMWPEEAQVTDLLLRLSQTAHTRSNAASDG